jgi:hypothetical protein
VVRQAVVQKYTSDKVKEVGNKAGLFSVVSHSSQGDSRNAAADEAGLAQAMYAASVATFKVDHCSVERAQDISFSIMRFIAGCGLP